MSAANMYRVRFNREHIEGYRPAIEVEKVQRKLAALLRRQGMTLNHADATGFEYYVQTRKARRAPSPSVRRRGATGRKLPQVCQWTFKGPRRRAECWGGYHSYRCPLPATTFLSDAGAYCDLHADKAQRQDDYWASKEEAV